MFNKNAGGCASLGRGRKGGRGGSKGYGYVGVTSLALRLVLNSNTRIYSKHWRLALFGMTRKPNIFPLAICLGKIFIVVAAVAAVFDLFMAELLWPLAEGVATSEFLTPNA